MNDDAIPVEAQETGKEEHVSSGKAGEYFKHNQETSGDRTAEILKHVGTGGVAKRASIFMGSPVATAASPMTPGSGPKRRQSSFALSLAGASTGDKCGSCMKTVYAAEKISIALGSFHKNCFRCGLETGKGCGSSLNLQNYDVYGGVIFCKACSKKQHQGDKQQKKYHGDGPVEDRRSSWSKERSPSVTGRSSVSGASSPRSPAPVSEESEAAESVASVVGVFSNVSVAENEDTTEKAAAPAAAAAAAPAAAAAAAAAAAPAADPAPAPQQQEATPTEAAASINRQENSKSFDRDDEDEEDDGEEEEDDDDDFDGEEAEQNNIANGSNTDDTTRSSFAPPPGQKSLHECPFTYPFDRNGAIYWVGTMGGAMDYENPQKTGSLYLEISTLYRGQLLNLTSYQTAETAADRIAAATYTNNTSRSWLVVDFGPERSLRPSYYCLKHGASGIGNAVRNWIIEGKVDEESPWVELRRHQNDTTMREEPQSVAGYELSSDMSRSNFFRIFRITQTGKNSGGNDCLFIGGIEFYGIMKVE